MAVAPLGSLPLPAEFAQRHAPLIDSEAVPNCPVCGAAKFHFFARGFDYELLTCANEWTFVECETCSHVWLNPRPAIGTLPIIYPSTYYAYNYKTEINPIAVRAKEWLDAGKMRGIVKALSRPPKSYMDVGCGDGRFLRLMESFGVERSRNYGLELEENVIAPLRKEGFQAYCERVEECRHIAAGSLDLVTMFHVIEHVDDPSAVVREITKWLAPGGVLAIETPNIDSLDAHWFHEQWWGGYHIPRHWNLFRRSTLERLCEQFGLEIVATRFQTGHSFWMYSLHHWWRYASTPRPTIARWFDPLKGLPFLATFTLFDKLRALAGARTSAMLLLARKKS